jgi:Tol biopolymer transport system component
MNRFDGTTDELIQAAFERRARRAAPDDLRRDILTLTEAASQQAAWRVRLGDAMSGAILRPAWITLAALAALLGIALAIALVGQQPHRAHAGLLAYIRDGDVYVANPDGSGAIRVVHDDGVAFSAPSWSPDGRRLALEASSGEFLFDPGTFELRRVATGRGAVWSSDGKSLALAASLGGGNDVIDMVGIDTGTVRVLQPKLGAGMSLDVPLVWSPDGHWFLAPAFPSACATVGCSPSSKRFVRIDAATGDTIEIARMYHLSEPGAHWSPDSRRFAYARPDACSSPPCQSTVVVEYADLSHLTAISDPTMLASAPTWSPDGAWIAYASATLTPKARGPDQSMSGTTLSIVHPDGRDLRVLVQTSALAQSLSWRADGSAVDFSNLDLTTGTTLGPFEARISDGVLRSVALPGGLDGYDWQTIPAERPVPSLPTPSSPAASALERSAPSRTPPAAPPADPSRSWSGIAIDADCDAGILDLHTLAPRIVGSRCQNSVGYLVFAPGGAAYAVPGPDRSVTVVRGDGSARSVLPPFGGPSLGGPDEVNLAWSPDGRWISVRRCVQDPNGDCTDPEYLVVSPDGLSRQKLPGTPSWSPDGRRLVVEAENGDVLVGSPDGSDLHSIGKFPMPSSWSPDASRFAFIRDGDAWIVSADGTNEKNVTHFTHGGAGIAAWSPDGTYLAVGQESQLWILGLAAGDRRPIDLGNGRVGFYGLDWSPDSSRLAVAVQKVETPATMIVRTEDWTATNLGGEGIESVAWSPDGRFIALLDRSSKLGTIDVANSDGSGRHTVWTASDSTTKMTWVP